MVLVCVFGFGAVEHNSGSEKIFPPKSERIGTDSLPLFPHVEPRYLEGAHINTKRLPRSASCGRLYVVPFALAQDAN